MPPTTVPYAVVFKTYTWDEFTERQARRCQEATRSGDFFISFDITNGDPGEIPFENVDRISSSSLVAEGWPGRVEHRSLLWWNADYPHYHFQRTHPQYDFYVFVEYDALFLGDWDSLVERLAALHADFAAFPLRVPLRDWHWAQRHAATYAADVLQGCLMCISVQSRRALEMLGERRLAMERERVLYWPSAEVFLSTEARLLGLHVVSLDSFADTTHFDWHPPCLEEEASVLVKPAFVHPVYDRQRFLRWSLAHTATFAELLLPDGPVLRSLFRLPVHVWVGPYLRLLGTSLGLSVEQRFRRLHQDTPPQRTSA